MRELGETVLHNQQAVCFKKNSNIASIRKHRKCLGRVDYWMAVNVPHQMEAQTHDS